MGRKTRVQKAAEALDRLNPYELASLLERYTPNEKPSGYARVEPLMEKICPNCGSKEYTRDGRNALGLSYFRCKKCRKQYNILTGTPLMKTPYSWEVWVAVLEEMLTYQSIEDTKANLIARGLVSQIDDGTVSAMIKKLRNLFVYMPLPTLTGNIQVDEKHFRESQKGTKDPVDVLDHTGKTKRDPHLRATASKYGTMGPEFSTICCAIDSVGHSIAKVVCMGAMDLVTFEDEIACHFSDVSFLCSDMNTVYTQYASIHKINQYVQNSEYHRIIKDCDTPAKLQYAYEQNKLDYVVGAGIMSYDKMCRFKKAHHLTINGVNAYHNDMERLINRIAKGVSTKHLQSWVSFYNYRHNYKIDFGHSPTTQQDAEYILLELLRLRVPVRVEDIKTQVDNTKKQPPAIYQKVYREDCCCKN